MATRSLTSLRPRRCSPLTPEQMETVNKGPEPTAWRDHRTTPGAQFDATEELKFTLLREGGFVCAYCGRRIPCSDPPSNSQPANDGDIHAATHRPDTMHVEHFWPRELLHTAAEKMDYRNLIACCPGFISKIGSDRKAAHHSSHCDHRKGARVLHLNIFQPNLGDQFRYDTNIKSQEAGKMMIDGQFLHTPKNDEKEWLDTHRPGWDKGHPGQMLVIRQNEVAPIKMDENDNVLNLNHKTLMQNRISVIKAIQTGAKKNGSQRVWWEKLLTKFSTMSAKARYINPATKTEEEFRAYQPYRSIAIFYIKKKLRQF